MELSIVGHFFGVTVWQDYFGAQRVSWVGLASRRRTEEEEKDDREEKTAVDERVSLPCFTHGDIAVLVLYCATVR